ncbi:6-pyruvoyltetrahydropterin/6-carboxytetrahydropterin synthase [Nonomuraea jabiensis]|uniref:6-carboxy-5,6,7,8-tetrahydropterin synthase n=2 Tax=Nonomuraea jabiensis TaxID=882448 RepID=A0A7W9G1F7_9ACTN|nr:6-pyruvoyltetrahydropterin/6-carboxytetrahydropterin synthase [Nonomuraea jabiensis]
MNLHGHSWWAEITVSAAELSHDQTVVEFGALKRALRAFIDDQLDHGAMLGAEDPLAPLLAAHGCKVFLFGQRDLDLATSYTEDLPHPTVEAVAVMLGRVAQALLADLPCAVGASISHVKVVETHVNSAEFRPVADGPPSGGVALRRASLASKNGE